MAGTLNMLTMVKISSLQPRSQLMISIFDKGGSNGNSTIFLPNYVKLPVLSRAPRIHSWYILLSKLSAGGASIKSNSRRSSTLSDFRSNTTFAKLVL